MTCRDHIHAASTQTGRAIGSAQCSNSKVQFHPERVPTGSVMLFEEASSVHISWFVDGTLPYPAFIIRALVYALASLWLLWKTFGSVDLAHASSFYQP